MATRYSGKGTVRLLFNDSKNAYRATVSDGSASMTIWLPLKGHQDKAVDSPAAYDEAAHAAISFATNDGLDENAFNMSDSGWIIKRKKG